MEQELALAAKEYKNGTLYFSFDYPLGSDLPPSFKSSYASISYYVSVSIRSAKFQKWDNTPFSIRGCLDTLPELARVELEKAEEEEVGAEVRCASPTMKDDEREYVFRRRGSVPVTVSHKSFMFGNGKVSIGATLDCFAYNPGQVAVVSISVNNRSSKRVQKIAVALEKHIIVNAQGTEKKKSKTYIVQECDGAVLSKEQKEFSIPLALDNAMVPSIEGKYLQVQYMATIRVEYGTIITSSSVISLPLRIVMDRATSLKITKLKEAKMESLRIESSSPFAGSSSSGEDDVEVGPRGSASSGSSKEDEFIAYEPTPTPQVNLDSPQRVDSPQVMVSA